VKLGPKSNPEQAKVTAEHTGIGSDLVQLAVEGRLRGRLRPAGPGVEAGQSPQPQRSWVTPEELLLTRPVPLRSSIEYESPPLRPAQ